MRKCSNDWCAYPVFRTDKNTNKGYCSLCWRKYSTDIDKRSIIQNAMDKIKNKDIKTKRKILIDVMVEDNQDKVLYKNKLDKWFEYIASLIKANPKCENCGKTIPKQYYKHASHHLFAKSVYEELSCNVFNYAILGANCCHDAAHTVSKLKEMKVFPKVVERYKKFRHLITTKHKFETLFIEAAKEKGLL